MSFLFEGAGTKTLKVDWGNWDFTEPVNPDPALTVGDITKLPLLGSGERPDIVGFAKEGDGSTSVVTKATQSFAQIDYTGNDAASFGGAFITYDDATTTTTVETIDFTAEFPTGLVIGVESVTGGANVTSVFVEVTDNTGATDTVELVSIATFGQRYKILSGVFFNVDMTKIATMSFLFQGAGTKTLKVDWGDFAFTPPILPDPSLGTGDITKLPLLSTGARPDITAFANSAATASLQKFSETFVRLSYDGSAATAFGGAFIAYDNASTVPVESINLNALFPTGIVIELDSPGAAITDIVFEVTDDTGKKDSVQLTSIDSFGQRWKILPGQFDQVNTTAIQTIAFVLTGQQTGSVSINWGEFNFIPQLTGQTFDQSVLHAFTEDPGVTGFGGNTDPSKIRGFMTLNATSPRDFNFVYDLIGSQTSFVVASISKGFFDGSNVFQGTPLSLPPTFRLALQGDDTEGIPQRVRVNIIDTSNRKASYDLLVTDLLQNFSLDLTNPGILPPQGFDRTSIARVELVVDRILAGPDDIRGKVNVKFKDGLDFIPKVTGDPFNAGALHDFTEKPDVTSFGGNVDPRKIRGFITLNVHNPREFDFVYDLRSSATSFTVASINKGFIDGSGNFQGVPLSLPSVLTLALRGDATVGVPEKVRVNITDTLGRVATFELLLTGTLQNFSLDLANADNIPTGFNIGSVASIEFVMDRGLAGNAAFRGKIDVQVKGTLNFIPRVIGNSFNASVLHDFTEKPDITSFGGNVDPRRIRGFITLNVQNPREFNFVYDLRSSASSFTVTSINKGFFDEFNVFQGTALTLPSVLVLALRGDAAEGVPNLIKVNITDTARKVATFELALTGSLQNFSLDLANADNIPAGFNIASIASIEFVMDRLLAGDNAHRGKVDVQVKGTFNFIPQVTGDPFSSGALHSFTEGPILNSLGGNTDARKIRGFITANVRSPREFDFVYDLGGSQTSFVVASITKGFFDVGGNFQGTGLTVPALLNLAVQGDATVGVPQKVRVNVVDSSRRVATFELKVTGSLQNFTLDLGNVDNIPAGFNINSIATIDFVVDRILAGPSSLRGKVNVQFGGGMQFVPVVNGADFDETQLTTHTNNPSVTATGANTIANRLPGSITLKQSSNKELEYTYNLQSSETGFVFVNISNGFFNGSGVFQGTAGSLPENFILAARGSEGSKMKIEITDTNKNLAVFILNLRPAYQNYTLVLSGDNIPAGFDRTSIAQIVMVEDRGLAPKPPLQPTDLVKVMTKGLNFNAPPPLAPELIALRDDLIAKGIDYFEPGALTVDAATGFAYDAINTDGVLETTSKFTQPTIIGFQARILSEAVAGNTAFGGLNKTQLIAELDKIISNLLSVQVNYGWNGLLPFLFLDQGAPAIVPIDTVGIGDNLNLIHSLAVAIGTLEDANLSAGDRILADSVINDATTFIGNQEPGYAASVSVFGVFHNAYNTQTQTFTSFIDRLATEFRGGVALAATIYPSVPTSVWNDLAVPQVTYTDRNGNKIPNLSVFDGSAFQMFWPLLSNGEEDFLGFRNALYNHFATQADFSTRFRIPGFLTAAEIPEDSVYVGDLGIRELQEGPFGELTMDVGSTYALASAYRVDPKKVLTWLKAISEIDNTTGFQGFVDSHRSSTEVAGRYLGIDIASTVLGLLGNGHDSFASYLRNRGKEMDYNLLYDSKDNFGFNKVAFAIADPPEFPDRTYAVLRNTSFTQPINGFPIDNTVETGVSFNYGALAGGFGGQVFDMDEVYNATANKLVLQYSIVDSPQQLKIELKDAGDVTVHTVVVPVVNSTPNLSVAKLEIDLPNLASLAGVKKVVLVIDQNATGDTSGNFFIHSMNFQHLPSSQNLTPNASLGSGDVTVLPGNPPAQLLSSDGASTLARDSLKITTLNFNLNTDSFAGVIINFDPDNNTNGADLSGFSSLVFGLRSAKAKQVKIEIDDANGNRAIFYATDINATSQYYKFLTSLVAGSLDLTKVKRINFVVDDSSVDAGDEIGSLVLEFDGLKFP
ncbi:MAG: hypothetical protein Q8R76_01550 [Candidatus Omnitrophota bacterium]|nr:hypothetical protein [Candidatus Omnitrophota bacterium]